MSFFSGVSGTASSLTEKMSILENGNVGINAIAPASKLEVNGKSTFNQGSDNAAIEIKGSIKVSGVSAPAFTVTYTGASDTKKIIIDHPACNADPNAMLQVTSTYGMPVPFQAKYDVSIQKWTITTFGYWAGSRFDYDLKDCTGQCISVPVGLPYECVFSTGQKFNVLVIKQ
jgi:hypothetical protein